MDAFWIILTGALVAAVCALPGSFLLLRRMTMIGDAISHAVLPGIVLAYLVTGSRAGLPMLAGAAAFGVLTTLLIEWLQKKARLASDAAIGISFSWFFSLGVILISAFTGQVDLDQDCILYGEIAYIPLDTWSLGGVGLGPRTIWILSGLLLLIGSLIYVAYKPLIITSFDPQYAAAGGIRVAFWHYVLMSMVSLATVLSFESVGAILVIAFLVGPAAAARLLTQRLPLMLGLAVLFGILASIGGYFLAVWIDGSIAGAMASVIGIECLLALIASRFLAKRSSAAFAQTEA